MKIFVLWIGLGCFAMGVIFKDMNIVIISQIWLVGGMLANENP